MLSYSIFKANAAPEINDWNSSSWDKAQAITLKNLAPREFTHIPNVQLKMMYTQEGFYGMYKVDDKYVRAVAQNDQDSVCQDSCVEFFVQPNGVDGYFNFEFNCGGTLLCYFVKNNNRKDNEPLDYIELTPEDLAQVVRYHSLPKIVEPEITEDTTWYLGFYIPFSMLKKYRNDVDFENLSNKEFRCGFFKCGDKTSHPHWVTWQKLDVCNYHTARNFGPLRFVD